MSQNEIKPSAERWQEVAAELSELLSRVRREARVEAFKKSAELAETLSDAEAKAFEEGMENDDLAIRLRRKVYARREFAATLRTVAAKERAQ